MRQRIMDAAEELFGHGHYDSISLREVADKADALVGLVTYHFKTKERLFEDVAARRAEEANALRVERLNAVKNPSIEKIFDAFIAPTLAMSRRAGWQNYSRFVYKLQYDRRWDYLIDRLFNPTVHKFCDVLATIQPDMDRDVMARGFVYMTFVLFGAGQQRTRVAGMMGAPEDDLTTIHRSVLIFASAGLNGLAAAGRSEASAAMSIVSIDAA